ncbi:MAG: hypothetical protein AAFW46_05355 [Pseudomonadota bacterium]
MTDLIYRGVKYRKEDLVEDLTGAAPTELVYRGVEHDGVNAIRSAQPVVTRARDVKRVYRGIALPSFAPSFANA